MEENYTVEGIFYSLRNRNNLYQEAGAVNQGMIIPALDMARVFQQAELSKKQREAVDCVYVFNLNYRETAEVLGCHYSRVARRIESAKLKVKAVLDQWEIKGE